MPRPVPPSNAKPHHHLMACSRANSGAKTARARLQQRPIQPRQTQAPRKGPYRNIAKRPTPHTRRHGRNYVTIQPPQPKPTTPSKQGEQRMSPASSPRKSPNKVQTGGNKLDNKNEVDTALSRVDYYVNKYPPKLMSIRGINAKPNPQRALQLYMGDVDDDDTQSPSSPRSLSEDDVTLASTFTSVEDIFNFTALKSQEEELPSPRGINEPQQEPELEPQQSRPEPAERVEVYVDNLLERMSGVAEITSPVAEPTSRRSQRDDQPALGEPAGEDVRSEHVLNVSPPPDALKRLRQTQGTPRPASPSLPLDLDPEHESTPSTTEEPATRDGLGADARTRGDLAMFVENQLNGKEIQDSPRSTDPNIESKKSEEEKGGHYEVELPFTAVMKHIHEMEPESEPSQAVEQNPEEDAKKEEELAMQYKEGKDRLIQIRAHTSERMGEVQGDVSDKLQQGNNEEDILTGPEYLALQLTVSLEESVTSPKFQRQPIPMEQDTRFQQMLASRAPKPLQQKLKPKKESAKNSKSEAATSKLVAKLKDKIKGDGVQKATETEDCRTKEEKTAQTNVWNISGGIRGPNLANRLKQLKEETLNERREAVKSANIDASSDPNVFQSDPRGLPHTFDIVEFEDLHSEDYKFLDSPSKKFMESSEMFDARMMKRAQATIKKETSMEDLLLRRDSDDESGEVDTNLWEFFDRPFRGVSSEYADEQQVHKLHRIMGTIDASFRTTKKSESAAAVKQSRPVAIAKRRPATVLSVHRKPWRPSQRPKSARFPSRRTSPPLPRTSTRSFRPRSASCVPRSARRRPGILKKRWIRATQEYTVPLTPSSKAPLTRQRLGYSVHEVDPSEHNFNASVSSFGLRRGSNDMQQLRARFSETAHT